MADFYLPPNSSKSFMFKTDKLQNLTVKIFPNLLNLDRFDQSNDRHDILRAYMETYTDVAKLPDEFKDIAPTYSGGLVTLGQVTARSAGSARSVRMSGDFKAVTALAVEVILFNVVDIDISGIIDVVPGFPVLSPNVPETVQLTTQGGSLGGTIDVPQGAASYTVVVNQDSLTVPIQPIKVTQLRGQGGFGVAQAVHLSDDNIEHGLETNVVALQFDAIDLSAADPMSITVYWNLFK